MNHFHFGKNVNVLTEHVMPLISVHTEKDKNIRTCNQCEYQVKDQGYLRKHKQAIHEIAKYLCTQCDYQHHSR